ncbi:hypothetical protein CcrColossus_gp205 [Caulobacter phage CcrColossus]|uniref:Uncharacterized protein n=1 Tax=Caulobacter phage CcrColossus TaxID=1211640 RepID=K4JUP6_9CAUD|nr:hypothetical protein CcrColossus_gp205 [Caulobacter phage CcrColossus]AFU88075.1 hypothetical protein CcrColossus_gp205 [Caulobacter phage CcrColossus]
MTAGAEPSRFRSKLSSLVSGDAALAKSKAQSKQEALGPVFDLKWLDPQMADASEVARIEDYERTRRFAHFGAAIAWARRQLFHGAVLGEGIELTTVLRSKREGSPLIEEEADCLIEITLAGFCKWDTGYSYTGRRDGYHCSPPRRKCRITDE